METWNQEYWNIEILKNCREADIEDMEYFEHMQEDIADLENSGKTEERAEIEILEH